MRLTRTNLVLICGGGAVLGALCILMVMETLSSTVNGLSGDGSDHQISLVERAQRSFLWRALNILQKLQIASPWLHSLGPMGFNRHLQNTREVGDRQNPDNLVGAFLTGVEKALVRLEDIDAKRRDPFYHYLLARTLFYDRTLRDAIAGDFRQIVFFGVGSDTRSFRFQREINEAGVRVIETDLEPWISRRAQLSKRLAAPSDYFRAKINFETTDLDAFAHKPPFDANRKTLFIAEGVTPYIGPAAHVAFLRFVSKVASAGSRVVYDAKFPPPGGFAADAPDGDRFRMPRERGDIAQLLAGCGLELCGVMTSAEAQRETLTYESPIFDEDVILTAAVC